VVSNLKAGRQAPGGWSTNRQLSPNPSAVSDAPHSECAGRLGAAGRVRYSGLKGAALGGDYANSIVLGLGEKLGEQLLEPSRASRGLVWWEFACGGNWILG